MTEPRRLTKAGAREEESLVGSRRQSKVKYIYRLLRHGDIGESLTSKTVYVLWPDEEVGTCTWYKAHVSECDVASGKGTIHYDETNETEECDLKELIQEGHIAFKEPRPVSHKPKAGEIGLNEQYLGRKQDAAAAADTAAGSDEQEASEDESDAAGLEDSVSDVSFSSAELAGRKRKRVGEDESDEEVELEEFEKREIMRDMSDDEKPLGWRAEDLERQKLKGSKQPKQPTPKKAAAATKRGAAARQQPPTRQRREAAAGVAAAVHAVAAVHAAMAADGEYWGCGLPCCPVAHELPGGLPNSGLVHDNARVWLSSMCVFVCVCVCVAAFTFCSFLRR